MAGENQNKEGKRKGERRGPDRRTGQFDEIYTRLVSREIIIDSRKGVRRKGTGRSGWPYPTNEEKYVLYVLGMDKVNLERKTTGLEPMPILSFEDWLKPSTN